LIQGAPPDPKYLNLEYTFEIVRHGARSPILDDSKRFDIVPDVGLLTPQGMRQRYLLGIYDYQKYGKDLGQKQLLEKGGGFEIQSTDVDRTIQSGYSELMGIISGSGSNIIPNMT
tara:strand:+ start:38 stop:382 length:345 start_codon:yes stop_codon:yes gene_type:complete